MARVFNDDLHKSQATLAEVVKAFRHAQEDLSKLREEGLAEREIRKVMLSFGFVGVTPDEFIAARTTAEAVRLIERMVQSRVPSTVQRDLGLTDGWEQGLG